MKTSSTSRPQYRGLWSLLLCIAALWIMQTGARAQTPTPLIVNGLSLRLDVTGKNNIMIAQGDRIELSADSVTPNGSAGTIASAQTINLTTGHPYPSSPLPIPWVPSTLLPNAFITTITYESYLASCERSHLLVDSVAMQAGPNPPIDVGLA